MNRTTIAFLAMLFCTASMAQMGMGGGMGPGPRGGMMGGSSVRQAYVMRNGLDPKYAGLTDPLGGTSKEIEAGRTLYAQDCAACHGARGHGDGPAGKALDPAPASLAGLGRMRMTSDGYLYWTIAEGGVPVGSAMPAFSASLKPAQIWSLVAFLRGL